MTFKHNTVVWGKIPNYFVLFNEICHQIGSITKFPLSWEKIIDNFRKKYW